MGEVLVRIDVKSTAVRYASSLTVGDVKLSGPRDFVILVALNKRNPAPRYWIVPADVAQEALRSFSTAKGTRTNISTREIEEYEDAWELLDN